jgi:hypothetical protein
MVKKVELRSGWAFRRNRQNIILTDADMVELLAMPGRYAILAPIHLTPQFLRRIGFKDRGKCLDLYHCTSKTYIYLRFHISRIEGQEVIIRAEVNNSEWDGPFYMHSLQQLYFATLGEEFQFSRSTITNA